MASYTNCKVDDVTPTSEEDAGRYGFHILNDRNQPIVALTFQTKDDAVEAQAETAQVVGKAVAITPERAQPSTIMLWDLEDIVAAAREVQPAFEHDTAWWRGHAKAEWRLEAQVYRTNPERPAHRLYNETALIGHFVSRAPLRSHRPCPAAGDYFGWLFLAQHYGLPTRLLDWTENPLVALYFGVTDHPDNDGCIWALWPTALNRIFDPDAPGLVQIRDPNVAKLAESAFTARPSEGVIIAIDGQEIDPRMLAQMSRFTLHTYPTALELISERAGWLRRYVIPKNAKDRIRAQLSALGVRRSNLFPDLATLATELKAARFG
jgi:hypothetical protein